MKTRREFLSQTIKLGLGLNFTSLLTSCRTSEPSFNFDFYESNAGYIHKLISGDFPAPSIRLKKQISIIGSGISGITCANYLVKNGITDIAIFEAEKEIGGNASYGKTPHSSFPWASHYIPIPNNTNQDLLDFFYEHGIITGYNPSGIPIYRESDLCFDPDERLLIHNRWQNGIIPSLGLTEYEKEEFTRFFKTIEDFKSKKGQDGKYFFDIPIKNSSHDPELNTLDFIPFSKYLTENDFKSPYLLWYLNYCCRDDFGAGIDKVSAFAGIHYFASRRGVGDNCTQNHFLTWENGNGHLMEILASNCRTMTHSNHVCFEIRKAEDDYELFLFDIRQQKTIVVESKCVVINTPLYVSKYLLKGFISPENLTWINSREYYPWITAGIALKSLNSTKGEPLSWDNVAYQSPSLGLVYAQHQHIVQKDPTIKVFTYYRPFDHLSPKEERMRMHGLEQEEIIKLIVEDIKPMINSVEDIQSIFVRTLGHGMISPGIGNLTSKATETFIKDLPLGLYYAHTDLSGYSIFEEGFYHGLATAKQILGNEKHS